MVAGKLPRSQSVSAHLGSQIRRLADGLGWEVRLSDVSFWFHNWIHWQGHVARGQAFSGREDVGRMK